MKFNISQTPDIVFGTGSRKSIDQLIRYYGKKIILVTGNDSFDKNPLSLDLMNRIHNSDIQTKRVKIGNEPTPDDINKVVENFKNVGIECVVAIGGGSVIDAGKAISGMLTTGDNIINYLEGVGSLSHPGTKISFIAMPTTAGTGSEATKNAVITEPGKSGYKKSLRHNNFVPDRAIIDPEMMITCPPDITAAGGMDALTQLVESYLSINANPLTDALAVSGIEYIINFIEKAVFDGHDIKAREAMAYAALLSGITLANAGLGVVHGFAQPLGSLFPIPHGIVCGTLMASVNKLTLDKILKIDQRSKIISKYAFLGSLVPQMKVGAINLAKGFIDYLTELTEELELPRLAKYNVSEADFPEVIQTTAMKNHPIDLTNEELEVILKDRL